MKRCVAPFATSTRVVAAGDLFDDNDPMVLDHLPFFADVSSPPRATLIPGTDKIPISQYPDHGGPTTMSTSDQNTPKPEEEGGLPVSTQSGPGAAEAERRQAEEAERTDDDTAAEDEPNRSVQTRDVAVEEATAEPGQKRNTGRRS